MVDPLGLFDEAPDYSPCKYYKNKNEQDGCDYHETAYNVFRGKGFEGISVDFIVKKCGATEKNLNCIRRCLVKWDAMANSDPVLKNSCSRPNDCGSGNGGGTGTCTRKSCIDEYHKVCFDKCGVNSKCYPAQYIPDLPTLFDEPGLFKN